jgi:serine/threonine protein kinase
MANIVSLTAPDGVTVQFVEDGDVESGGMKDVYFAPDRSYVVAFYRDPLDETDRERLEKLVGNYRKNIFENEGGEHYHRLFRWPERIVEHNGKTGLVVPIYEKKFFFAAEGLEGTEKAGNWFASPKNFNRNVPKEERGTLMGYFQACLELTRAVKRLHAAGLAHSDLSYKNVLVDPVSGSACVIDIDGLVVPGLFPPGVVGTRDFIAPEVVHSLHLDMIEYERIMAQQAGGHSDSIVKVSENPIVKVSEKTKRLLCAETDLHALAVLIYHYLLHRHPLRGRMVWSQEEELQETMEMGEKALFIEHPDDPANRLSVDPDRGDEALLPWIDTDRLPFTVLGPFLGPLFLSAFVTNLHNPSGRPIADDWEDALVRTMDLLLQCKNPSCPKGWYVVGTITDRRPSCPYCDTPYPLPALPCLDLYSTRDGRDYRPDRYRVIVQEGTYLYPWHVYRDVFRNERLPDEMRKSVGYFAIHRGNWMFVNQRLDSMYRKETGEQIKPGAGMILRDGDQVILSRKETGRMALIGVKSF